MATDHFEKRQLLPGQIDWNFNLIFKGDEAVAKMVNEYKPALIHPGLYPPVPPEWLHTTILRVGTTEEFTEDEMLAVAEKVQADIDGLSLPEFSFDSWWMLFGNVIFHISPDDEFTKLYDVVTASVASVLGSERASKTLHGRYLSHSTFAYAKTHQNEHEIIEQLRNTQIAPARFRAAHMALVKQWPNNGHYEWEVIKQIELPR